MSMVAYIVQWEDHKSNVLKHLRVLFEEQKFVDVTLFCNTHSIRVHSVLIASNSTYFERVLLSQNGMNSVIVLKDMKFEVLRALIEFMYCGETSIKEEDIDALLYAAKKFEINGLSRMTRQDLIFFAQWNDNETLARNLRMSFPAKPAQPGVIQAVIDISQKEEFQEKSDDKKSSSSLFFQKTVLQRRSRAKVSSKNRGNTIQETALSDTEYAILKEAEESRRALENLQKYVADSNNVAEAYIPDMFTKISGQSAKRMRTENLSREFFTKNDFSENETAEMNEDEIAVKNLTEEINEANSGNVLETVALSTDLPTFVDDGNGNYVALDDEVADMISGQEIKYHLVQGIVMTQDDGGNQFSNPANILVPETHVNNNETGNTESYEEFDDSLQLTEGEYNADDTQNGYSRINDEDKQLTLGYENVSSDTESDKDRSEKKPFIVKEMECILLTQPKKGSGNCKNYLQTDEMENITFNTSDIAKQCFDPQYPNNSHFITAFNSTE